SARSSVEVTVDQYALGTRSGLARPSQFVTGGRPRHRPEATASPGGHRGTCDRIVQTTAPAIRTRRGDLFRCTIRAPTPSPETRRVTTRLRRSLRVTRCRLVTPETPGRACGLQRSAATTNISCSDPPIP